jgi:hypothetical protein
MLRRYEAELGHQPAPIFEPAEVTDSRHEAGGRDVIEAADGSEVCGDN